MGMNKNDDIHYLEKNIQTQELYNDFEYKKHFEKRFVLIQNHEQERIEVENYDEKTDRDGCVYAFVINGRLIKIGSTTTSFKKRVQSYNCGKKAHRKKGTCSTTNFFVLQNLLNYNKKVDVYVLYPPKKTTKWEGYKIQERFPSSKSIEKIINTRLKEHGVLPALNTQK